MPPWLVGCALGDVLEDASTQDTPVFVNGNGRVGRGGTGDETKPTCDAGGGGTAGTADRGDPLGEEGMGPTAGGGTGICVRTPDPGNGGGPGGCVGIVDILLEFPEFAASGPVLLLGLLVFVLFNPWVEPAATMPLVVHVTFWTVTSLP